MTIERVEDPPVIDVGRRLLAFNWLPAGYAHRDWLGPWGELMTPRGDVSLRLVRRVSLVLIDRLGLRDRYVKEVRDESWLLEPHERLRTVAGELGRAMLGGWVRYGVQRADVALQVKCLGAAGRRQALDHAQRLTALPFPDGQAWPVPLTGPAVPLRLGVSCLATLLESERTGARERFLLRFPSATSVPLALSTRQRDEALAIVSSACDSATS